MASRSKAAAPETWGTAIDVPLYPINPPPICVEQIQSFVGHEPVKTAYPPGASKSISPLFRLVNHEIASNLVVAPTEIALGEHPG